MKNLFKKTILFALVAALGVKDYGCQDNTQDTPQGNPSIVRYGPRLEHNSTAQLEDLAEWMVMRTGLNKSEGMMVLQEPSEAIIHFSKDGTPVKFPGAGIFSPSVFRRWAIFVGAMKLCCDKTMLTRRPGRWG
jgi:hypothetical protein